MVYLTPIFPARSNHRYDAAAFDHVDPLLGGDEALARLADAAHARVACGCSATSPPTTVATPTRGSEPRRSDAGARPSGSMFYFRRRRRDDYESWLGVAVAAEAELGQRANCAGASSTGRRRSRSGGCGRRTGWTAGGSTCQHDRPPRGAGATPTTWPGCCGAASPRPVPTGCSLPSMPTTPPATLTATAGTAP